MLKVDPWPQEDMTQFEWYVPGRRRHALLLPDARPAREERGERAAFEREFHEKWIALALNGFNDDDVWAREAGEEFYGNDMGWVTERLYEPDMAIVEWRKFASRHNRGIQRPEHAYAMNTESGRKPDGVVAYATIAVQSLCRSPGAGAARGRRAGCSLPNSASTEREARRSALRRRALPRSACIRSCRSIS